jgi:hypothetical protein
MTDRPPLPPCTHEAAGQWWRSYGSRGSSSRSADADAAVKS